MTTTLGVSRIGAVFGLAFVALASTVTCVIPEVGQGKSCEAQAECSSGDVCIRIDPEDEGEGNVCLPMLELDAPQACTADEDCAAAGFPVDSSCDGDGRCACDLEDGFSCDGFDEIIGEHSCRCVVTALATDDECVDDNQCASFQCGDGNCVDGEDGDGCDLDEDCANSATNTCNAGTCE